VLEARGDRAQGAMLARQDDQASKGVRLHRSWPPPEACPSARGAVGAYARSPEGLRTTA
jgi:hypothetical protein